ncbi:MAG: stalk domain-containing protein, partial [Defluviitaleaceae bacterium]|nr:stalk domain-containing protein [Defluviitaleaceae bacterium]
GVVANNGTVVVTNATSIGVNARGVFASNNAKVTVRQNATGGLLGADSFLSSTIVVGGNAVATGAHGAGALADGPGSIITVAGNAIGDNVSSRGAWAVDGGVVNVGGNATATGAGAPVFGAQAQNGGIVNIGGFAQGVVRGVSASGAGSAVNVTGNVTATGGSSVGAHAEDGGRVAIGGLVTGAAFVNVGGTYRLNTSYNTPTTRAGYFTFHDAPANPTSTVWVQAPASVIPPVITAGTVTRTGSTTATVEFSSNQTGHFFWQVDGTLPTAASLVNAGSNQTVMTAATNTILLTGLSAGQRTLYIAGVNAAVAGNMLTVTIPAFVTPITGGAITVTNPPASGATVASTSFALGNTAPGAITWTHSGGAAGANFGPGRVYTAVFTLTAAAGFNFNGLNANTLTVAGVPGATITHPAVTTGNAVTVTIVFPATAAPTLTLNPTTANITARSGAGSSATVNVQGTAEGVITFTNNNIPAWITLTPNNTANTIAVSLGAGVPVTAVNDSWTVTVNREGQMAVLTVNVNIAAVPPTLSLNPITANITARSGAGSSAIVNVQGTATGPITFTNNNTPAWINLTANNAANTITVSLGTGVPVTAVNNSWTVTVNRQGQAATLTVNVNIAAVPPTLSIVPTNANIISRSGAGSSITVNVLGTATGAITITNNTTPPWVNLTPNAGANTITVSLGAGVPITAVNDSWTVTVNRQGQTVNLTVNVNIFAVPPNLSINPTTANITARSGAGSSAAVNVQGTATGAITFTNNNTPAWINLTPNNAANTITVSLGAGVPVTAVNDSWTVMVNRQGETAVLTVAVDIPVANQAPVITIQPESQSVQAGNNVTFTAAATGVPAPTFQWQVSTNNGASWANVTVGGTSETLALSGVTLAMNGNRYRVVIANSQGTVTSDAAILTVTPVPTVTPTPAPTAPIITGPAAMSLTMGYADTVSEAFTITGRPAPTVTIGVTPNTGLITWDGVHNRLNIAAGLAAGTHTVTITAANGVSPNAAHTFTLTVHAPQQPPPTPAPSPPPSNDDGDTAGGGGAPGSAQPRPTPTPAPSPSPTPAPSPTPQPALPLVWVELSQGLRTELQTLIGFSSIDINIETSAPDSAGGFVTADISFSVPNGDLNRILNNELPQILQLPGAYYTIYGDLSGFVATGVNYHRIAALHDGAVIGGGISSQDMIFSVDVRNMGEFSISYVANLRRLVLSLDSFTITDIAGNAPTQTMDIRPVMQNNRTLIPLRFIAEAFGAEVDWTPATGDRPLTVYIHLNGQTLSFGIGELTPQLAALGMDVPPQLMDNRTMVPLRFVVEFFGAVVSWDGDTRGIEIIWSSDMEAYFDR